jgi:hypothetical protein
MNDEDKILVPIIWKNSGQNVYVCGTFPNYNYSKLSDVCSDPNALEKSILIWLKPGKYYYNFIVDGERKIDEAKPIEFMDGNINK